MAAETIAIRYAADKQAVTADRLTLQCYSSCARGLPAAAEEWDVSGLMIEGGVQRQTVVDYVNAISKVVNSKLAIDEGQSEGSAAVTLARMASLLAFADAVGSSRGLMLALDAEAVAGGVVSEVQFGQEPLQLQLQPGCCYHFGVRGGSDLWFRQPKQGATGQPRAVKLGTADSPEEQLTMRRQLAQQLEATLHLAYKLQLPKLLAMLKACVSSNCMWGNSLLNTPELLQTVLSARVLDAAQATSSPDLQQAFTLSYTSELCSFVAGSSLRHLLQPVGLTAQQKEPLKFEATVVEDFSSFTKRELLDVEVDLMGGAHEAKQLPRHSCQGCLYSTACAWPSSAPDAAGVLRGSHCLLRAEACVLRGSRFSLHAKACMRPPVISHTVEARCSA